MRVIIPFKIRWSFLTRSMQFTDLHETCENVSHKSQNEIFVAQYNHSTIFKTHPQIDTQPCRKLFREPGAIFNWKGIFLTKVHEQKLKGALKRITQVNRRRHEGFDTINFQTKISNKKCYWLFIKARSLPRMKYLVLRLRFTAV